MFETDPKQELRFFRKSRILEYIYRFSPTERVIFGLLTLLVTISAATLAVQASEYFMQKVPARGGELREGVIGLPRTINPILALTDVDRDISTLVYAGLMKYVDGKLEPDLAQSYSISEDGLTYTFILRPDAQFHDGMTLTADDVEFTITKIQDPNLKSPRRADWSEVTISQISPLEIQFTLKQPYAPFLSNTTIGILPKHIWSSVRDEQFIFSNYNIEPIGAGPYRFSKIVRDAGGIPTEYKLTAWDKYYPTPPFLQTIVFDFFPDYDKALEALDQGTITSIATLDPQTVTALTPTSTPETQYTRLTSPLPRVFGIFFNQAHAPLLADTNIRQALEIAVDRKALVENVFHGQATPLDGPLPPGFIDEDSSDDSSLDEYDVRSARAAAQTLIEKSGWKKDENGIYIKKPSGEATTTLSFDLYTADVDDLKQTAELVKDMWSEIGVIARVKVFEGNELYQNTIRTRKFDALLFGQHIGRDRDLYAFWHSSQRNAPGLNVSIYTNIRVDKLLDEIRSTQGSSTKTHYAELKRLIAADIPAVFLYSPDFIYIVPHTLKGVSLGSITTASDRWNSVTDWYTHTEKVWSLLTRN